MRYYPRKIYATAVVMVGVTLGVAGAPAPASAAPAATVAPSATVAAVRATGGLAVRSGPETGYERVGVLADSARVAVTCAVIGERIAGEVRTTDLWDRLPGDRYISHGYVLTRGPVASCPARPPLPAAPALPNEPNGSMSTARFVAASAAGARRSQVEFGVPASVTIAQAILESGWGKSGLAATDRNFFGLKCFTRGPIATGCRIHTTSECDTPSDTSGDTSAGTSGCFRTEARFRTYASVTDSFRDHGRLLATAPRYQAAFAFGSDPDRFAQELQKAGYATSPTYASSLQRIMKQYDLYRFDLRL